MSGKSKNITMNHWFYTILKPLLRFWLKREFNLKSDISDEIKNLAPPYLILPNHQGFWDPFMAGMYIDHKINYIGSDAIFRSPFFKVFMNLLGVIPKTKAQSDIDALKNIITIKDRGGVIGIFPEGRRTWDGVTLPLVYSTSKLIRMLGIPVVTVLFKGGYFSQPRWGFHIQKGEVFMEYKILFHGNEVRDLKVGEIHKKLTDALYFDEFQYNKEVQIIYRGKKSAEYLERVLFTCPVCKKIGTMHSENDKFYCQECRYEVKLNNRRIFESNLNKVVFDTIRDWNQWQQENLVSELDKLNSEGEVFMTDDNLRFHTGYKSRKPDFFAIGNLSLLKNTLIIRDSEGRDLVSIPMEYINGLNVQNKEILEFYFEGTLYTIRGRHNRFSAYKWLKSLEYLQKDKVAQFQQ